MLILPLRRRPKLHLIENLQVGKVGKRGASPLQLSVADSDFNFAARVRATLVVIQFARERFD